MILIKTNHPCSKVGRHIMQVTGDDIDFHLAI
jgi:bisdemethoxycurcumin synthase